uniref:Uncharacterized protein n=1 Tax=Arundo donax TaxID=35708 RepID=A0A0A9B0I8_ARUDO
MSYRDKQRELERVTETTTTITKSLVPSKLE